MNLRFFFIVFFSIFFFYSLGIAQVKPPTQEEKRKVLENLGTNFILPQYRELLDSSQKLLDASKSFCVTCPVHIN